MFTRIDTLFISLCLLPFRSFYVLTSVWYHVFIKHSFNVHSFAAISFSVILSPTKVKFETTTLSDILSSAGAHERSCLASNNCQY